MLPLECEVFKVKKAYLIYLFIFIFPLAIEYQIKKKISSVN